MDDLLDIIDEHWHPTRGCVDVLLRCGIPRARIEAIKSYYWYPDPGETGGDRFVRCTHDGFRKVLLRRAVIVERARRDGHAFPRNDDITIELTNACNRRCKHCYHRPGTRSEYMEFELLFSILEYADQNMTSVKLVGGEPFLDDRLLILADQYPDLIFNVATNASLLDEDRLRTIRVEHPNIVPAVSLEGFAEYNDVVRGPSGFETAVGALQRLSELSIPFHVVSTITRVNREEVLSDAYIDFIEGYGPVGIGLYKYRSSSPDEFTLTPEDIDRIGTRLNTLLRERSTPLFHEEPLERDSGLAHRRCKGLLTVDVHGDVWLCPGAVGPVFQVERFDETAVARVTDAWFREVGEPTESCPLFFGMDRVRGFLEDRS